MKCTLSGTFKITMMPANWRISWSSKALKRSIFIAYKNGIKVPVAETLKRIAKINIFIYSGCLASGDWLKPILMKKIYFNVEKSLKW